MNTPPTSRIDGIHAIWVPVTDQGRARWSSNSGLLGLDIRADVPMPQLGERWIEVAPPDGGVSVALVPASNDNRVGATVGIRFTTSQRRRAARS